MAAKNYLKAAEGFDVYPAGAISTTDYPWNVSAPASTGSVAANAGAFTGANALAFTGGTATPTSGLQYTFPTNARAGYNTALATDRSVFGIGFWFNMNQMTATTTSWLINLGSSATAGMYSIFGITAAAVGAPSMMFPTNMGSPGTGPITYPIVANTYYWVDIRFAIDSTAKTWQYEYRVNDVVVATGSATWAATAIAATNPINRLYFYLLNQLQWKIDDMVVRSACAADTDWVGSNPTVLADINPFTSRRIYVATPTANGSVNQWTSSDAGPNYLAATDPTGAKYVSASDVNQTDLYKFTTPAGSTPTDISGVVYRGASPKLGSINPQFKPSGGAQADMAPQSAGASHFVGLAETDGTAAWTAASIAAAEFGQKSI